MKTQPVTEAEAFGAVLADRLAEPINTRIGAMQKATRHTRNEILFACAYELWGKSYGALARQLEQGFDSVGHYVAVCRYFHIDPVELLARALAETGDTL